MHEDSLVRKVLLHCVKPEKESLFGDIPNRNVEKAIETAGDREKWKKVRPSQRYLVEQTTTAERESVTYDFAAVPIYAVCIL